MAKAFVIKCPKCHDGTLIFDTWQRLCCDRCASYLRCVSCNSNDIRHQLLNGEYVFDCKVCRTTFGLPAKPKSVKSTPREIDFKVKPDFSGSTSFAGVTKYYLKGKLHRLSGAAIERRNGDDEYWIHGKRYRSLIHFMKAVNAMKIATDQQAGKIDNKFCDDQGRLHCDSGPAIVHVNGTKFWYQHGERHRLDGPAVIYSTGRVEYWIHGNRCDNEDQFKSHVQGLEWFKSYQEQKPFEKSDKSKIWLDDQGRLHRESGPAIIYPGGNVGYYLHGRLVSKNELPNIDERGTRRWVNLEGKPHRPLDLPAVISIDGSMYWYKDGLRHRANGPAVVLSNGTKMWFVCDNKHRIGGPAVEYYYKGVEWWLFGKRYATKSEYNKAVYKIQLSDLRTTVTNQYNDKPTKVNANGTREWHNSKGQLHRENGPALELKNQSVKEWYFEGQLHRDSGPAVEHDDGHKEWWLFGNKFKSEFAWQIAVAKKHKKHDKRKVTTDPITLQDGTILYENDKGRLHREDGPALINSQGEFWYWNGSQHRVDGPAVILKDGSTSYYLNGIRYAMPDFKSALSQRAGSSKAYEEKQKRARANACKGYNSSQLTFDENDNQRWEKDGKLHRENGPALIDSKSRQWYRNGLLHREDGPAIVNNNGDKIWCFNGLVHRSKGPAKEYANGDRIWYWRGKIHRRNNPAAIYANGDKHWKINGVFHREDGPAIEKANGEKIWFVDGIKIDNCEKYKKALENHNKDCKIVDDMKRRQAIRQEKKSGRFNFNDGNTEIYVDGKLHCINGPAVCTGQGQGLYYLNGERFSFKEDYEKAKEKFLEKSPIVHDVATRVEAIANKYTGILKLKNGDIEYYLNGQLHREDGPATTRANGEQYWYLNGQLHREDGPAVINSVTSNKYYLNGRNVSEYEVAKIDPSGSKVWRNSKGLLHRSNGPAIICPNGTKYYYQNGQRHRDYGPAVIFNDGVKQFWKHDKLHREIGPAIEFSKNIGLWFKNGKKLSGVDIPKIENGILCWYNKEGKPHRLNAPARIDPDGKKYYYNNGELHNVNGPAILAPGGQEEYYVCGKLHRVSGPAIIDKDGNQQWYFEGKLHRENGPAIIRHNEKRWYKHGLLHREDGPALINADGSEFWYLHGKQHRESGPAVITSDGTLQYWTNGVMNSVKKLNMPKSKKILIPEKIVERTNCEYCGNEDEACPHCYNNSQSVKKCPKCKVGTLFQLGDEIICINADCNTKFKSNSNDVDALLREGLEQRKKDFGKSDYACPICRSNRVSPNLKGLSCDKCDATWYQAPAGKPINIEEELMLSYWTRHCDKCNQKQPVARMSTGELFCLVCRHEWPDNGNITLPKSKKKTVAVTRCRVCDRGTIEGGVCTHCYCASTAVHCPSCRHENDIDDMVLQTMCSACSKVISVPKSIFSQESEPESNKQDYHPIYELLNQEQIEFAAWMFKQVPDMDVESFKQALRFIQKGKAFENYLNAVMENLSAIKEDITHMASGTMLDAAIVDLEDNLQELSEISDYINSPDDDEDDIDQEDEVDEADFESNGEWDVDLWTDRAKYNRYATPFGFRKGQVDYSDVSIEEVEGNDLIANEEVTLYHQLESEWEN